VRSIIFEEDEMRKLATVVLSVLVVAGFAAVAWAQNSRGTSSITIKGKTVSVEYGRPSLKGRTTDELLGKLPAGGFWRLGADTSTTFKSQIDLSFGDVSVPAGEFSLWMQKEGEGWKLVFNKQHGQWGTQHDASKDFASAPLKTSTASTPVEMVTLTLRKAGGAGGTLTIQWGTLEAVASFTAK
jgi:hypothetical protein